MAYQPRHRRRRRRRRSASPLPVLIPVLIIAIIFVVWLCVDLTNREIAPDAGSSTIQLPTIPEETTLPEVPEVIATATVGAQGDLLMHKYLFASSLDSVCQLEDGSYDFSSIFRYTSEYTTALDYAVANLETTFGGPNYPYRGNPEFNCPDPLADAIADAGYDMLLTANNHASDTHTDGILRTVEQIRSRGLTALGTQGNADEDDYAIVDVNGIRIGMLCYTYADNETSDGRPSLNFRDYVQQAGIVNYFTYSNLPRFYSEVETLLAQMKEAGAEATMLFIHWGQEYYLEENATQNAMAQSLCDLGIDVIVGGHPHVVQPMELLESTTDPDHRTVCIYSLGNAVSNQRREEMNLNTGHTEDGVLFTVTFEKYSDGSVYLSATDVIPTWVDMHYRNGGREYNILPLDDDRQSQWQDLYNLTDAGYAECQASYARTMAIVGDGLTQCQTYLAQAKAEREQPGSAPANAA